MSSNPPQRVRLKGDPGRIGVTTGKVLLRGGRRYVQVLFPDGTQYVPEDNLEFLTEAAQDPLQELRTGRLARAVDLRRALTHMRLTGRLADIIYSMDTTSTDFYAYQFKPVLKLLDSATNGILVADEVGLGKTIEAGLIWTELRIRFDFRRLVVLCPAVLREKWQRELRRRFGVRADICGAKDVLARLQRSVEEGPLDSFALIGSLQGLRPRKGWEPTEVDEGAGEGSGSTRLARFLDRRQHEAPVVDVLIIDEAHYLRNPETMTAALGRLFREVADYVLLLSATPIHLRSQDLFQLVRLIDRYTFDHLQSFDAMLAANRPLVRLRDSVATCRLRRDEFLELVEESRSHPFLASSRQLEVMGDNPPSDDELRDPRAVSELCSRIDRVNLLGHVVTRTRKRDVIEWQVVREAVPEEIPLSDTEREFYSTVTEVVRDYCERFEAHEGFLLVTPQRQMSSSMPAALRFWQGGARVEDEELFEDLGAVEDRRSEQGALVRRLLATVRELADFETLRNNDSKYLRLRTSLQEFFACNPGSKAVLFAFFRATLSYLYERLHEDGIRCILLHGGTENKEEVIDGFRAMEGSAVLLSSEVGSEGIDLQFSWLVVNYDLPWNPMRLEQRIGRLDRLGQESPKILIWNLFYKDTIDSRIYHRLLTRLGIFEQALGSLEPILGEEIRALAVHLLSQRLTPKQEADRITQTSLAIESKLLEEESLEAEAGQLVAYGDYILNQVQAARELSRKIDGSDLRSYVIDYFTLHWLGCEFLQDSDDELLFRVRLSTPAAHDLEAFIRKERLDARTRLTTGPALQVRCRFENSAVEASRRGIELISQFHPLVRFVSAQIQKLGEAPRHAVAVSLQRDVIPPDTQPGIHVFAVQRWSITGLQDREKLYMVARRLVEPELPLRADVAERLVVAAAARGSDWIGAAEEVSLERAEAVANDYCLAEGDQAFDRYVGEIRAENEDRIRVQLSALENRFQGQMTNLQQILERHRSHGRTSLASATEGRMRALENRAERRRYELEHRREMTSRKDDICVGLIRVEAEGERWS